ncbi:MAG: family oligoendopeptidase, partial [Flavipsychrobacter sp.]|nr:family oligoendopeptidase [Flavipsychrobacter sp.]
MNQTIAPLERNFLPKDFTVTTWDVLRPYFEELKSRPVENKDALGKWLSDISELEAVISEDASWRQIRMTCDTTNQDYEQAFTYFCLEIEPKMKPYFFELNKKLLASPFIKDLDESMYYPYLRSVK